ncbi:MAG: phasin family protein [Dokdonella sp.]
MAKPQSKSSSTSDARNTPHAASENVMESAHQIWLAGLGAFAKAQVDGGKWFEALVNEGAALDAKTRQHAEASARELQNNIESAVGNVRARTLETWDKVEKVFEGRVARAIEHLGVPGHEELSALAQRVEKLSRDLRKLADTPAPAKTAKAKRPAR